MLAFIEDVPGSCPTPWRQILWGIQSASDSRMVSMPTRFNPRTHMKITSEEQ